MYTDELQPDEDGFEKTKREREERKYLQVQEELLKTPAGRKQLVHQLSKALPIGGGLFIGNSTIYRNTSLADDALERLAEIRKAITYEIDGEIHYNTNEISKVLLTWFFGIEID